MIMRLKKRPLKKKQLQTSLMVQWLGVDFLMQRMRVQSLARELRPPHTTGQLSLLAATREPTHRNSSLCCSQGSTFALPRRAHMPLQRPSTAKNKRNCTNQPSFEHIQCLPFPQAPAAPHARICYYQRADGALSSLSTTPRAFRRKS